MGGNQVAARREVGGSEPVETGLFGGVQSQGQDQRRRWLELTREVLPGVAEARGWPIRLDHCFMRVFLDNAMGGVWHDFVKRPAIRHIGREELERAVALAERVLREPGLLEELNRRSLRWRRGEG